MKKNSVPKEAVEVKAGPYTYRLGRADAREERIITVRKDGGEFSPLNGSGDGSRWGVTRLEVGQRMVYYPAGCYDPDDGHQSVHPVTSIIRV